MNIILGIEDKNSYILDLPSIIFEYLSDKKYNTLNKFRNI